MARLPDEERIAWIRQEKWIQYPRAERILARLVDLVDYPPRDRMPCLVIFGATGMGKTRVVHEFLRHHKSSFDRGHGRTRMPVVYIQMPPTPTERNLYEEILAAMGGIFTEATGVTTLRHRVRNLAHQLGVRMLVIDEIHSLLAGTFREQRIALNAIRFLANDLRIALVCVGTQEANRALMTDQQLADRFEAVELPPWENDSAFHQLLLTFESIIPLRSPSDLKDPKVHQRILGLSEGVMVRICRLIEAAATEAIRSKRERIDLSLLHGELFAESLVSISDRVNRRVAGR
jgi:Bacterial TniB protein